MCILCRLCLSHVLTDHFRKNTLFDNTNQYLQQRVLLWRQLVLTTDERSCNIT